MPQSNSKGFLFLSATKLADMIRSGEATSREIVQAHVDHAKKANPKLNAIVHDRFDKALAEADAADKRIASGEKDLPPLLGVPCTIKECFGFTGFPQTSGLVSRKDAIALQDAPTVARIRAAGAIPLGITNVPELCMWMETHNRLYGRTNNPYNHDHIVGGSSGGEGAIIGSGASPFGIGSDVGGSIRMPAFFNGVFGHKPSSGTVPNTGQFPIAHGVAMNYLSTGPLARKADDLMPLLRILAGPDGEDPVCVDRDLGDPSAVDLSELTVIDVRGNQFLEVSPDLLEAQERAADHFAAMGATVKKVEVKALKKSVDIWSAMLGDHDGPSFGKMLGNGKFYNGFLSMLAWSVRQSDHTLPAILLSVIEPIGKLTPKRTQRFIDMGHALRDELNELIGEKGIMLYPSYTHPAPRHLKPLAMPLNWVYTAILNVMELPVTQVPLGLNKAGLPLGVQVAGIHGNDHVTIAAAIELERAFGGWVPPKTFFPAEDGVRTAVPA